MSVVYALKTARERRGGRGVDGGKRYAIHRSADLGYL